MVGHIPQPLVTWRSRNMLYLNQRDPRWGANKIGTSNLTIARWGCTLTCISMLSDYFGAYMSPDRIASQKTWFTKDGLVWWGKFNLPTMKFTWRQYGRNDARIMESLKSVNGGCILQVDNSHWVLAVRKTWLKNDYIIVDPWTGKIGTALGDYKSITGSAHFVRK